MELHEKMVLDRPLPTGLSTRFYGILLHINICEIIPQRPIDNPGAIQKVG